MCVAWSPQDKPRESRAAGQFAAFARAARPAFRRGEEETDGPVTPRMGVSRKMLIANRSEIAIRVMRAASELGIRTVAIFSHEDRFSLHRFKADEAYLVGEGKEPVQAYLDIEDIIARRPRGQGRCHSPRLRLPLREPGVRRGLCRGGDHLYRPEARGPCGSWAPRSQARELSRKRGSRGHAGDRCRIAPRRGRGPPSSPRSVGFPVMAKASWGGGGRGMRVIERLEDLEEQVAAGRREALAAFGKDEIFLEKLVRRARHVEVQLLADRHGNQLSISGSGTAPCSGAIRKVVERAPAPLSQRRAAAPAALRIKRSVWPEKSDYEMRWDGRVFDGCRHPDEIYFIEVNPRIQVEHTVSEEVTGIDIVKAQIQ